MGDEKRTFRSWFANQFWPYHKWLILGPLAVGLLTGLFIYDRITHPPPDATVLVLSNQSGLEEKTNALAVEFGKVSGDAGEESIYACQIINPDGGTYEAVRFELLLSSCRLCLLGEDGLPYIESRAEEGYWADLTEYGLDTVPGKPYLANLAESKTLSELGLDDTIQYAVILIMPQDTTKEIVDAQNAAVQCIREGLLW